jgi:hypothetical protein
MDARQQKHRNKHNCSEQEGKIHHLRHDIGEKIAFGHERLLDLYPKIIYSPYMGLPDRIYENAIELYFRLEQIDTAARTGCGFCGAAFAIVVTRASSSPEHRSL